MARTTLNFTGAGVAVTDDAAGDQVTVAISGGVTAGRLAPRDVNLGSVATTQNVDFSSLDYDVRIRLTLGAASITLNLQNVPALAQVSIRATQDATGGRALVIQQDASTSTIKWDGGVAHAMTSAANATDRIAGEKAATNIEMNTVGKAYA